MGVLDDAIREHLDLKRRRGATEEEISRAETEALGPARRAAPPQADDEPPADQGETVIIAPMDDVAPPPDLDTQPERSASHDREPDRPVAPVHDIDEELAPPPPPLAGARPDDDPVDDERGEDSPSSEEDAGGQGRF